LRAKVLCLSAVIVANKVLPFTIMIKADFYNELEYRINLEIYTSYAGAAGNFHNEKIEIIPL
jgi:hypothetical protein